MNDTRKKLDQKKAEDLGKAIRSVRKEKYMGQRTLSEISGLPTSFISNIENGKVVQPSIKTIKLLASALGVPPDPWLVMVDLLAEPTQYDLGDIAILDKLKNLPVSNKVILGSILDELAKMELSDLFFFGNMLEYHNQKKEVSDR